MMIFKTGFLLILGFGILQSSITLAEQGSAKADKLMESCELKISKEFFDTGQISRETHLDCLGRKIKVITYSTKGGFNLRIFDYKEFSYIESTFHKNSNSDLKRKVEKTLVSNKKIREWRFSDDGAVDWIDSFKEPNEKQIITREFLDSQETYHFTYKPYSKYGDEVESFFITNETGETIGSYQYDFDGDVYSVLESQFSGPLLQEAVSQVTDSTRIPVAIIDSGFDLSHHTITPYLFNNPFERWGSQVDLDGNGLPGDVFGWGVSAQGEASGNINEPVIIGGFKPIPLSHGSHVASIAMKNRKKASLYGFAGNVGSHKYLNLISEELSHRSIKLANMSWGFKEMGYPSTPPPETYEALKNLIKNNPNTLFHVAAGNNAWDLDSGLSDYPSNYTYPNLLVIGALNVGSYDWQDDSNLIPAIFKEGQGSNVGETTVDAFAPGKKVNGAKLGGGMVEMSGTSMASPFALNATIAVQLELPDWSALKIKEIMLKSVGFVEKDLPCLSKGFIHPNRSLQVAKILRESPEKTVEDAVVEALDENQNLYPGEVTKPLSEMQEIWSKIDASFKE